jgi:hypothetical protein
MTMADPVIEAEARLTALRARRRRWETRYAAVENEYGKSQERSQAKANISIVDKLIVAAETKLYKAQRHAAIAENVAIEIEEEEIKMQRSDLGYFPPVAGMVLRANATLNMDVVAKELRLPNAMIRRGTFLLGKAAEAFLASRNADTMLRTRMVIFTRPPPATPATT